MASCERGKGKCPNCLFAYANRYKQPKCTNCGFHLGGTFIPKNPKKAKLDIPLCSSVVVGPWSVYSCKTSNHDDRCLVIKDCRHKSPSTICLHHLCKQARAVMVNSSSSSLFTCEHVKTIESAVQPEKRYFDLPDLQGYKCGDTVRSDLLRLGELSGNLPLAVKVSPLMFCVFGHVSSNNPAGYCHVKVQEDALKCYSKDCKTFVAKAKQNKAKNICIHVHVLISLGIISNETFEKTTSIGASASATESASASGSMESMSSSRVSASASGSMESTPSGLHSASASGSMESAESGPISTDSTDNSLDTVSRLSTVQLNMKRSLPLQIPSAVIGQAHSMDIKGWPPSLSPSCFTCGLCNSPLSEPKSHPGQRGDAIVLTNLIPFRKIKLFVKFCQSK